MARLGDRPAFPPPDWVLTSIRTRKGGSIHQPTTTTGATTERERKYAQGALDGIAQEVAATGKGGRNNKLNTAAFRMGTMVARGWIGSATVTGRLIDACVANGLLKDDGQHAANGTIKSGIDGGMKKPHPDLGDRERDSVPGDNGSGGTPTGSTEEKKENGASVTRPAPGERSITAIRGDKVKPESISWAWKNRFAFGKMAMLAGDPGLGKSTLLGGRAPHHRRGFPLR